MSTSAGLNPEHVLEMVVRPALKVIALTHEGANSTAAEQLLMGTAAKESDFRHLQQLARADGRRGPALGIFQMEPVTHDDIWKNYLSFRRVLSRNLLAMRVASARGATELAWNLQYAAAMARVHYLRAPKPLPSEGDIEGMARYWDAFYNCNPNEGTPEEFVAAWHRHGLSKLWT